MILVVWWCRNALLLQGQSEFPYLAEPWILLSTKKILKENVRTSVQDLKLKHIWVMQQWPSQSPDLNPDEMQDVKQAVWAGKPFPPIVAKVKQFSKEAWAKFPPQRCERLIFNYLRCLVAVVHAKGGTTSYFVGEGYIVTWVTWVIQVLNKLFPSINEMIV